MINQPLSWESIRQYILQSDLLAEKPRTAVTGWYDGSLSTTDRPNFIKVRFYDDNSEVEVYNVSVPLVRGVQVSVYKGLDGVLRARDPSRNYTIKDLWFSFVKNHADNHSVYSVDPLYVQTRSLLSMHPYVSGPWDISVKPGWMVFGDQAYWFQGEAVNVKQYRPDLGARFVLLSAGLQLVDGAMAVKMIVTPGINTGDLIVPNDFPKIPEGTVAICVVKVSIKRIKLQDRPVDGDIYDLRLSSGIPSGSTTSTGTQSDYHTEPITFNGELLFLNGDIIVMEVHN
jgi:hypothetical protein